MWTEWSFFRIQTYRPKKKKRKRKKEKQNMQAFFSDVWSSKVDPENSPPLPPLLAASCPEPMPVFESLAHHDLDLKILAGSVGAVWLGLLLGHAGAYLARKPKLLLGAIVILGAAWSLPLERYNGLVLELSLSPEVYCGTFLTLVVFAATLGQEISRSLCRRKTPPAKARDPPHLSELLKPRPPSPVPPPSRETLEK